MKTNELVIHVAIVLNLLFPISARCVEFTVDTTIDVNDLTYEGQDVVVNGCTVTIDGRHQFDSLELWNNAVVIHSRANDGESGHMIDLHVLGDVLISKDCQLTANSKGYGPEKGPGGAVHVYPASGGSYGGIGGGAMAGPTYGSLTEPTELGSGGSDRNMTGGHRWNGGSGGGAILLTVEGTLTLDGDLTANGANGQGEKLAFLADPAAGGGSGGSILLRVGVLSGSGIISATGGDAKTYDKAGGGGGGRIAVYCNYRSDFTGVITVSGGAGHFPGEEGTLFWKEGDVTYSGGTGDPNDPYQIATAADLIALGETQENYDKHFILTADIDMDPNLPGRKVFDKAVIAHSYGTPFTGVFNGDGFSISNLTIDGRGYSSLFGRLESGAEVKNLQVLDVSILGFVDVGGWLGLMKAAFSSAIAPAW